MLTDHQLKELYKEAEKEGFVTGPKPDDCNQMCDECPAGPACDQLSEGQDYPKFIENFKELYRVMS